MNKLCVYLCLLLICSCFSSYEIKAQVREVNGIVYDYTTKETLPGVNIRILGTNTGTITDAKGKFKITIDGPEQVLRFSFVGMKDKEIRVGQQNFLEVYLESGIELGEVIVTALGISRTSKSLGYSVANLKSDELNDSRETNLINAMAGKVAGIDISSSSGGIGSSSRILIRGVSNLSSNNQPLFVIDGVPVSNSLRSGSGNIDWGNAISDINVEDIEEMSILKGAGAAALYGSQAANGVIVIKTKSGKTSQTFGIELNSNITFSRPFRSPSFQNKYGPGTDPEKWDFWQSDGLPYFAWGPLLDAGNMAVQWSSPLGADGKPIPLPLKSYKNNFKDFFETGILVNNTISFSKAEKDKYHYRLSFNDIRDEGILYSTGQDRQVISLNAGTNVSKKLKISTSAIYTQTSSDNRLSANNYAFNAVKGALFMPRSTNVKDLKNYKALLENGVPLPGDYIGKNFSVVAPGYSMATADYFPNPYFTLDNLKNEFSNHRIFAVLNLEYKINDWLSFDIRNGIDFINELYEEKCNDGVRHWNGSMYSYKGFYSRRQIIRNSKTTNFKFNVKKDFSFVDVNAYVGGERRDYKMDWANMYAPELIVSGVFNMSNTKGERKATNGYSHKQVNSLFASIDLSFKNGLYVTLTGRNDWSSTLPKDNRSYFYPAASLSWVLSESFSLPEIISFAKFRLNASQVGSDTWAYQLERSFYNLDRLGNVYEASVENTLKNPNLLPTRTNQYEIGFDLRLLDNRLNLDLALYTGSSFDQITPINIASSSGYTNRNVNVGEVSNKGIELAVNSALVKHKDFQWELGFTYTKNKNEVISLAEGVDALPIGSGYSGIRTEARPNYAYGNIIGYALKRDANGNIVHVNGLPQIDDEEVVLGNITPDWIGSLTTRFSYKNFSLSALFTAKMGGDMFSLTTQWMRQYGLDEATDTELRQGYVVGEGVMSKTVNNETVYVPNNVSVKFSDYSYRMNAYGLHETAIFDASYVKLKELRLSYTLPDKLMAKLPFKAVNIAIVGRNLALLYAKVPHVDPESAISADNSKQGFELFNMPSTRSITFYLAVKL